VRGACWAACRSVACCIVVFEKSLLLIFSQDTSFLTRAGGLTLERCWPVGPNTEAPEVLARSNTPPTAVGSLCQHHLLAALVRTIHPCQEGAASSRQRESCFGSPGLRSPTSLPSSQICQSSYGRARSEHLPLLQRADHQRHSLVHDLGASGGDPQGVPCTGCRQGARAPQSHGCGAHCI
jgi:hypothetical protein